MEGVVKYVDDEAEDATVDEADWEKDEADSARAEKMESLREETSKGTRTNSWSLQMPPTTPFGGSSG